MTKKYQVVAVYDSHIVVLDAECHFRDFSSTRIIERPLQTTEKVDPKIMNETCQSTP